MVGVGEGVRGGAVVVWQRLAEGGGGTRCGCQVGDDDDAGVAVEDVCSGVVTVVAKVAAGWWRPRWCGDCEGSGGERVTKMRCDVGWG
ncbi:hypothetical protein Tco_0380814, partial [Tanacetum coccineum]